LRLPLYSSVFEVFSLLLAAAAAVLVARMAALLSVNPERAVLG
jgi:hypothetical protein